MNKTPARASSQDEYERGRAMALTKPPQPPFLRHPGCRRPEDGCAGNNLRSSDGGGDGEGRHARPPKGRGVSQPHMIEQTIVQR